MNVTVKTKLTLDLKLIDEIENTAKANALEKTANWLKDEVVRSKKIPLLSGDLQGSVHAGLNQKVATKEWIAKIVFDTPYARRWYFNTEGVTFRTEYNANAQDHWMDDFIHGERQSEIKDKFAEFYREELKGILK